MMIIIKKKFNHHSGVGLKLNIVKIAHFEVCVFTWWILNCISVYRQGGDSVKSYSWRRYSTYVCGWVCKGEGALMVMMSSGLEYDLYFSHYYLMKVFVRPPSDGRMDFSPPDENNPSGKITYLKNEYTSWRNLFICLRHDNVSMITHLQVQTVPFESTLGEGWGRSQ